MGRVGSGGIYSQPDRFSFERDGCSSRATTMTMTSGVLKYLGVKRLEPFSVQKQTAAAGF